MSIAIENGRSNGHHKRSNLNDTRPVEAEQTLSQQQESLCELQRNMRRKKVTSEAGLTARIREVSRKVAVEKFQAIICENNGFVPVKIGGGETTKAFIEKVSTRFADVNLWGVVGRFKPEQFVWMLQD